MPGASFNTLQERILRGILNSSDEDPETPIGSEAFYSLAGKEAVFSAIRALAQNGYLTHEPPITGGVMKKTERIAGLKLTAKGKTAAEGASETLAEAILGKNERVN